jgi:pimeloyl-ACP methyl ester carboxylesterase
MDVGTRAARRDQSLHAALVRAMGERGRYVRYDARGCGPSKPAPAEISFDRWVDYLEAVAASVSDDPVNVLGFSQGAAVAIGFAVRRPGRVARLILHGLRDCSPCTARTR